jgi:hypothetical protein
MLYSPYPKDLENGLRFTLEDRFKPFGMRLPALK